MPLFGWGRFPAHRALVFDPRDDPSLAALVQRHDTVIARGNGRAYGDSAINPESTISTRHFNRMLAFDGTTGQLVSEAGVTLAEVIATFLPRGWFPMVAPGTAQVTLGGAIAADVHGKNHVRDGSFRTCVDWIDVMGQDGSVRRLSLGSDPIVFDHTLGGMGLTGIILRAAIRLRPIETGWLRQTTKTTANLPETLAELDKNDTHYSVAWLDARRDRGLVMRGEHAVIADLPHGLPRFVASSRRALYLPFDLPSGVINRATADLFNAAYFSANAQREGIQLVGWEPFFFPLDKLLNWNRVYGRRGLVQFQCVLPHNQAEQGLNELLHEVRRACVAPVLSVLKSLGAQASAFSFPMAGITLAVDFPASPQALALLDRLDCVTLAHGGRFYLAKDARLSAETLHASDPRACAFAQMRTTIGTDLHFQSVQSRRLKI